MVRPWLRTTDVRLVKCIPGSRCSPDLVSALPVHDAPPDPRLWLNQVEGFIAEIIRDLLDQQQPDPTATTPNLPTSVSGSCHVTDDRRRTQGPSKPALSQATWVGTTGRVAIALSARLRTSCSAKGLDAVAAA